MGRALSYRRPELDGLRGIAIAMVIGLHAHLKIGQSGYLGVDVFFVLSGYLITRLLLNDLGSATNFRSSLTAVLGFARRRAARLVPAMVVALLLVLALSPQLKLDSGRCAGHASTYTMNIPPSAADCPGPWHVFWSLAAEEQFYLLWPLILLIWMLRGSTPPTTVVLGTWIAGVGIAFYALQQNESLSTYLTYAPFGRSLNLLLGCAWALAGQLPRGLRATAPLVGLCGWALLGWAMYAAHHSQFSPALCGYVAGLGTVFLLIAIDHGVLPGLRLISNKVVVTLGKYSYSLYLVHLIPLWLARRYISDTKLQNLAGIALAVLLAVIMYHFVEQPGRRFARPRTTNRQESARERVLVNSS